MGTPASLSTKPLADPGSTQLRGRAQAEGYVCEVRNKVYDPVRRQIFAGFRCARDPRAGEIG